MFCTWGRGGPWRLLSNQVTACVGEWPDGPVCASQGDRQQCVPPQPGGGCLEPQNVSCDQYLCSN